MPDIAKADLIVGTVYRVKSRNLIVAVWTGDGFIGIREKFNDEFLFKEYAYEDGPPYGTVHPVEDLGVTVDSMPLTEHWGLICGNCRKGAWKDRENWVYPDGNHCAGGCGPEEQDIRWAMNQMLFDALLAIELPIRRQQEEEFAERFGPTQKLGDDAS